MTADFIADNPKLVFPLLVFAAALGGATLLVLAWRSRRRVITASIGALAGLALLFVGAQLQFFFRINRLLYELQERTGYDVASYTLWTVGDGAQRQLGEFRGRPILLYLWATTCGPCRPSLPALGQLASDVEGRAVVILLSHEDRSTLVEFARKQRIPAIAAYAPEPRVPPGQSWAFPQGPRPTTFIIDSRGVLRRVMVGHRSGGYLRAALEALVVSSRSTAVQQRVEADKPARRLRDWLWSGLAA
jgi:thiol-disulfide isomerase/thioredoxin